MHRPSDDPAESRPAWWRFVDVESAELGLTGRCDDVEFDDAGVATVVEYKSTPARRRATATDAMSVQVALQVVALREAGHVVVGGAVWFSDHQVRVEVATDCAAIHAAREHVDALRSLLAEGQAPEPLVDDPLVTRARTPESAFRRAGALAGHTPGPGAGSGLAGAARRDTRASRLTACGACVPGQRGRRPQERAHRAGPRARRDGNVDVLSGLLRELLWRRLPVVWCSGAGRVIGWASSASAPNGSARVRQHVVSADGHIGLARAFVAVKIANQATLLRRRGDAADSVRYLRELQRRSSGAASIVDLYGIEGDAAARYFEGFSTMFEALARRDGVVDGFTGRSRRPARDPINFALNFVYGLLVADVLRAVVSCGLDPHAGFLHSSGRNKPALALDLCEEFRAPIADSVVVGAFNNGKLRASSFSTVTGSARLRDGARSALVAAYERRVNTEFRHPTFGYQVTWRRATEIQARLVLGVLDGTQREYKGVVTR